MRVAEDVFGGTLARVSVDARIAARVTCDKDHLRVRGRDFPLRGYRRIGVIAIGKAAASMTEALIGILVQSRQSMAKLKVIVVSGSDPAPGHAGFTYVRGGHPLPTTESVRAAEAIFDLLSEFGPEDLVLFLISGGASAMVERPLDSRWSLEDVVELYRALVSSGLPIGQMNCVRKHLSAVKGGRLAVAANGATQLSLLVSDVPGTDLSVIGSGPSLPDPSSVEECKMVLHDLLNRVKVSAGLTRLLGTLQIAETPKPEDPAFANSWHACVLSPADLMDAAGALAKHAGFHVEVDNACDDWDYADAAAYLIGRLRDLRRQHARVCVLSGGELSVRLPGSVGVGGRNQQFALRCALLLRDSHDRIAVLSAGTDGLDGNSPAAGAIVNQQTCSIALSRGIDPQSYENRFDSYNFFQAMNATIITGPTENNLRDLRILLSEE